MHGMSEPFYDEYLGTSKVQSTLAPPECFVVFPAPDMVALGHCSTCRPNTVEPLYSGHAL